MYKWFYILVIFDIFECSHNAWQRHTNENKARKKNIINTEEFLDKVEWKIIITKNKGAWLIAHNLRFLVLDFHEFCFISHILEVT